MTQTTQSPPEQASPPAPDPQILPPTTEGPIRVKRLGFTRSQPAPSPEVPEDAGPAAGMDRPVSSEPPPEPKPTKSGSSQGSSLVDLKVISEGIEGTVIAITGQVHELLARDAYDRWALVYLADKQDAQGIAGPAAKILNRHTGELTGGNPDVADGIMVGIAAAFYVVKQLGRLLAAKRARRDGVDLANPETIKPPAAEEPAYAPA